MDDPRAFQRWVLESSPDGIWVLDLTGRTLWANQRTAELLGRTQDELAGLTVHDVLDEAGRAQFDAHLEEVRRVGANDGEVQCTYLRGDGTAVRLMVSESLLHDDQGRVRGYVHRLVTDARRQVLVDEITRSREQLDEAQAIARVGSWEVDLETGEMSWSRQLYAMLGLAPETFVPSRLAFLDLVLEPDRTVVAEVVRSAEDDPGDGSFEVDARVRRADGTHGWVRLLGRPSCDEHGRRVRFGGTVQDITEVKEVELQLVDAVVLNTLMQVMATAANKSETLVDALDVTRQQLLGHDDWERAVAFHVVPDDDGFPTLEPYLGGGDDPTLVPTELERRTALRVLATGDTLFEEEALPENPLLAFPLRIGGRPRLVVVITNRSPFERHEMLRSMVEQVADQLARVGEREDAASELAAARDAAMAASRLKSDFLATMSHEIRTPMNGVIGLNELLLRTDLDPHQRRLAQGVQVAGQALLGLINDILDFSKIEAGELELELVDFDVRSTVEQVVSILTPTAQDKDLELVVDVAPDVPARLVGDPTRLGQILSNLVSNAVKFTEQGAVTVRTSLAESDGSEAVLRFEVSDTGIGISADQKERLFEPFRQADASTTRTFGGTGLGLAIARRLVNALGGEIGVRSTLGQGSTFWFTGRFGPATDRPAPAPVVDRPARDSLAGRGGSGTVLVVEDNEINQLVALGLLEAIGYTGELAVSGEEAVSKAATTRYDAILMDVQMPGLDGYAASRLIRAREPRGHRVPIIAMTASAIEGERERCLAAGMDDFLTKPVDTTRLGSLLRAHARAPRPDSATAAAPPVRPPALDPRRLQELVDMGPRAIALVERAIDNFIARAGSTVDAIRAAVEAVDTVDLRARAHQLKGSALNLGAARVAEVSHALEILEEADAVRVAGGPLVDALHEAMLEAQAALREYRTTVLAALVAG